MTIIRLRCLLATALVFGALDMPAGRSPRQAVRSGCAAEACAIATSLFRVAVPRVACTAGAAGCSSNPTTTGCRAPCLA